MALALRLAASDGIHLNFSNLITSFELEHVQVKSLGSKWFAIHYNQSVHLSFQVIRAHKANWLKKIRWEDDIGLRMSGSVFCNRGSMFGSELRLIL